MKKLNFFLVAILAFSGVFAQSAGKIRTVSALEQGKYVGFNVAKKDTIKKNDTLSYVFKISHANDVNLVLDQRSKLVASDTTVSIKFYESVDGITYYPVKAGTSPADYAKTYAKGATTAYYQSNLDVCWFSGRFLKVMYIGGNKTGLKKIPFGYLQVNIK